MIDLKNAHFMFKMVGRGKAVRKIHRNKNKERKKLEIYPGRKIIGPYQEP